MSASSLQMHYAETIRVVGQVSAAAHNYQGIPMADIEKVLKEEAKHIAHEFQLEDSGLEAELIKLEERKQEIEAKRKLIKASSQHAERFDAKVGPNFLCPNCAIRHGAQSVLTPVPYAQESEDIMRCHACNLDFTIPG